MSAKWLKNVTFCKAGKRRLFTAVTQPLLWLHFQLLYKCHSKVKYNIIVVKFLCAIFGNNYVC